MARIANLLGTLKHYQRLLSWHDGHGRADAANLHRLGGHKAAYRLGDGVACLRRLVAILGGFMDSTYPTLVGWFAQSARGFQS
jgi:hypothetical protein